MNNKHPAYTPSEDRIRRMAARMKFLGLRKRQQMGPSHSEYCSLSARAITGPTKVRMGID